MFVLIIAAWWVLGLVGLEGGRMSSFQLLVFGLGGFLVYCVAGAHRRRTALARHRLATKPVVTPRTCVVLRRFGEDGDHAPSSDN